MPLTKLFQKRHSLNEVSVAKLANEELEKLKSSFKTSRTGESQEEQLSVYETKFADLKRRTFDSEEFESKYEYIEKEECDSKNDSGTVFRRNSAPTTMLHKFDNGKLACKENLQKTITSTTRRKKCVSESNTHDTKSAENKTLSGLGQVKENPLENLIGRYVNQLIKESIITAVNSVNVESICEEIMGNVSDFNSLLKVEAEEHCEIVEEKISFNSDECMEKVSGNIQNCTEETAVSCPAGENNFGDVVIESVKQETASLDGYIADLEESMSLHSTDLESKEENAENKNDIISDSENYTSNAELTNKSLPYEKNKNEKENNTQYHLEADNLHASSDSVSCEKGDSSCSTKIESENIGESINFPRTDDTDLKILVKNVCPGEKVLNNASSTQQLENTTDDELNTGQSENTIEDELNTTSLENTTDDDLNTRQLEDTTDNGLNTRLLENTTDDELNTREVENTTHDELNTREVENTTDDDLNTRQLEHTTDNDLNTRLLENTTDDELNTGELENTTDDELNTGIGQGEPDLILISSEKDVLLSPSSEPVCPETKDSATDLEELLPQKSEFREEEKKHNWKVGYMQVKLPHKTRSKGNLKAWKKRCVSIQPDEFVNDPKNPSLMISVYSAESGSARKHGASFWKSISCQKAVVYRSSSRTHKYAFTISDDNKAVIHLAGENEATSQDWMTAIRAILWPPSPVVQLEKMLYGKEFEVSIIDNDFSLRAGLLGMYGYLTITHKKLILVHPQQGFVIQEWYLNTIDKFELVHQVRIEDVHKVLSMTTCSDSSTGKGEILMYCMESIAMLQAIASTIHQILTEHTKRDGGKYEKELAEMADWLVPAAANADKAMSEDYYQVPPRQVKSLLDIPNFIFNKPLVVVESESCSADENMAKIKSLEKTKDNSTRSSQDSGISAGNVSEDLLNCSSASFVIGGGNIPGKSSESELSDSYTPPRSPEMKSKGKLNEKITSLPVT